MKKGVLIHLYILSALFFGLNLYTQPAFSAEKTILQTLKGDQKTCPYVKEGLYKPFSNISTDFVLFKEVLNVTTKGNNTDRTECLQIAGSTDRFVFMVFRLFIGFSSVLAVIYIAIAGIGLILEEADPKKRISYRSMLKNALIGLLLSVSAWVILYTINNRLVGLQITSILGETRFGGIINQGVTDAKNANVRMVENPYTGTGASVTVAGNQLLDNTDSAAFTTRGNYYTVAGVGGYTENGYQPVVINGITYYTGKTTTFGGAGDINNNSFNKLAIDNSMTESDLDQDRDEYISARWVYSQIGVQDLRNSDVEVINLKTNQAFVLRAGNGVAVKDWGPHPRANSDADFDTSRAVLRKLGVQDGEMIGVRLIPKK